MKFEKFSAKEIGQAIFVNNDSDEDLLSDLSDDMFNRDVNKDCKMKQVCSHCVLNDTALLQQTKISKSLILIDKPDDEEKMLIN